MIAEVFVEVCGMASGSNAASRVRAAVLLHFGSARKCSLHYNQGVGTGLL